MSAALSQAEHEGADLVGTYHRIGEIGPPYEVVATAGPGMVQICLLESGDTAEYPVSEVREDPSA